MTNRILRRIARDLRLEKWDGRMMEMALLVSTWSKDPKTQVGCVIADDDNRILGVGYNGFPRGVIDAQSRYDDQETKLAIVKHAEENAVFNSSSTEGATAYVTLAPCVSCAGTLIQSGVKRVVFPVLDEVYYQRKKESHKLMLQVLSEAGVIVETWDFKL